MRSGNQVVSFGVALSSLLVLAACGRESFSSAKNGLFATGSSGGDESTLPPDYVAAHPGGGSTGDVVVVDEAGTPGDNAGGTGNGGGTGNSGGTTTMPPIPGAKPGDLDALHRCLAAWPGNPFMGAAKIDHFKEIFASVSVLSNGAAINDTESTPFPELILVDAGVNVLGTPSYNLLNKNGYYCVRVNVNVLTKLAVNLHCNARLADPKVAVSVLSTQNDATAGVGVNVLSDVKVSTVRPDGDTCVR